MDTSRQMNKAANLKSAALSAIRPALAGILHSRGWSEPSGSRNSTPVYARANPIYAARPQEN